MNDNVGKCGIHFITFSIFAFSSVIGNYFYVDSNILFIKDSKFLLFCFRITCIVALFFGAQADIFIGMKPCGCYDEICGNRKYHSDISFA